MATLVVLSVMLTAVEAVKLFALRSAVAPVGSPDTLRTTGVAAPLTVAEFVRIFEPRNPSGAVTPRIPDLKRMVWAWVAGVSKVSATRTASPSGNFWRMPPKGMAEFDF